MKTLVMNSLVIMMVCVASCAAQFQTPQRNVNLHRGLTESIGNFSIELLYHTASTLRNEQNFIMSPITVWNALAIIAEGATGETKDEITRAIRLNTDDVQRTRSEFRNISQWLTVSTPAVQLAKINTIFVNKNRLMLPDFQDIAKREYDVNALELDFNDNVNVANTLNGVISNLTHGLIPSIVEADYFQNAAMVLTSAVYFKGQWTVPFNASSTMKMPFYNSNGQRIGEVNMMYNRYTYPFSNFKQLQARVIELPYGFENRLSMLIMLPNPGVTVEDMFRNFANVNLDTFFEELRISKEQYSDDEVDCLIPRFKAESDIDLTNILQTWFGVQQLFSPTEARLPLIARTPLHVSKMIHKAKIEVTEEGTTAAAVTAVEFSNRIGVVQFQANRPFTYIIIEKVTNSIVFGGFYKQPSLY